MTKYYGEPITTFEKVRNLLLTCAYNKAMWQSVEVTSSIYKDIRDTQVATYSCGILECYKLIKELKEKGQI